ncbi:Uncharacterized protein CLAVI_000024 [Candidatus Clavichlamydia salmonicola]|uniref:SycD/LcrH family type III secretion system chaperone n=1 Tax=Candidatus Clavichlamydia salmonicola TaxID=469812 RepID=UPI001E305B9C|nr:SycD/LcrH family type III secretion system chaperone [Candidatus Clavichlamydia salmonicola]MBF5050422.1 Uncharacterized protein [Candidatus Clavichlamydia salmonicola]
MLLLKSLLNRIISERDEEYPFPDNLETYMEGFIPNPSFQDAIFQKVFNVSSDELEQIYKEGYEYYISHSYPQAITVFRWLLFFNPFISKYWNAFGSALKMHEEYEKALQAYAVMAVLNSEDPYPHYYAYLCYRLLGKISDAITALECALEKAVDNDLYVDLHKDILAALQNETVLI